MTPWSVTSRRLRAAVSCTAGSRSAPPAAVAYVLPREDATGAGLRFNPITD